MSRVVIVGTGHVGRHFAEKLASLDRKADIVMVGNESAYNRTLLIKILDGSATSATLAAPCLFPTIPGSVTSINLEAKTISIDNGENIEYDTLVLATGAAATCIPGSPPGVFALRTLEDAEKIASAAARVKSVAVIGAGTLGVEAACALRTLNPALNISLIHGTATVLDRMLDRDSGEFMASLLAENQINVRLGTEANGFTCSADGQVSGIELPNSEIIPAELVITAIGVKPNTALAMQAGLACENGIIVDETDSLTSAPDIYAIGDCTNHSVRMLEAGYRQADNAAFAISNRRHEKKHASSSAVRSQLKTGHRAYSVGVFEAPKVILFKRPNIFRKLFLNADNRLIGAIVFGAWDELPLIEHGVMYGERVSVSRQWLFRTLGLTTFSTPTPQHWNDSAIVCQCKKVSKGQIMHAMPRCNSVEELTLATAAGSGCGGCKPLLAQLLQKRPEPVRHHRPLHTLAIIALLLTLLLSLFAIPYPDSFTSIFSPLYRNTLAKQITGYSLLALTVVLSLIGIIKRTRDKPYDGWKLAHVITAVLTLGLLALHSGGRFGSGLTFGLSTAFIATMASGGVLALIFANAHQLEAGKQNLARRLVHWLHILFLWPLPVLLAFHILQGYLWS